MNNAEDFSWHETLFPFLQGGESLWLNITECEDPCHRSVLSVTEINWSCLLSSCSWISRKVNVSVSCFVYFLLYPSKKEPPGASEVQRHPSQHSYQQNKLVWIACPAIFATLLFNGNKTHFETSNPLYTFLLLWQRKCVVGEKCHRKT